MEARQRQRQGDSEGLDPKVEAVQANIATQQDDETILSSARDAVRGCDDRTLYAVALDLVRVAFGLEDTGKMALGQAILQVCQDACAQRARSDSSAPTDARMTVAKRWSAFSNEPQLAAHVDAEPLPGSVPLNTLSGVHRRIRRS